MVGAGQRPARLHAPHIVETYADQRILIVVNEPELDVRTSFPLEDDFFDELPVAIRTVQELDRQLLFGDGSRPHLQRVGHTAGRGRRIIGQRCTVKTGNNSRYRRLRILRTAIPLARAQREQQRENQKQFLHFFSCLG